MAGGGHSVQPHCWSHASHHGASREWIRADIDQVLTLLGELGVESPQFWRPPWGRWQLGATDRVAEDRGLELTGWTTDSTDYAGTPAAEMLSAINAELEATNDVRHPVVLMHDCPLEPGQWRVRQSVTETIRLLQLLLDDDKRVFGPQAVRVPNHLYPSQD